MTTSASAAVCPACGAPMELDEAGRCRWCRATVQVQPMSVRPDPMAAAFGADPRLFELCDAPLSLPQPPALLLSGLNMLGKDPQVYRQLLNPTLLTEVRDLTGRVQAAGERVADTGRDRYRITITDYVAEEIWCFRLARDLTVSFATLEGVEREKTRLALDGISDLTWDRRVRKTLTKYGDGPPELRELRARVPLDALARH